MDINSITSAVKNATDFQARKQGWNDWMQKPENRAFMLQTGISLLQGPSPGQTMLGSFGSAIGEGAQARDRSIQSANEQQQQQLKNQVAQQESQRLAQSTQLDKRKMALEEARFKEAQGMNASLRNYREKLGLSSILRAQKPGGRTPKSIQEEWQSTLKEYMTTKTALGEPVTDADIADLRAKFIAGASGTATPADTGLDWTVDADGNPVYVGQ